MMDDLTEMFCENKYKFYHEVGNYLILTGQSEVV